MKKSEQIMKTNGADVSPCKNLEIMSKKSVSPSVNEQLFLEFVEHHYRSHTFFEKTKG